MVDFNTRVFTEDDGKIIGAEITVYSDSGDKIGLIDVADAETLEEMQTQLAVIDETYFTEARLATILANTNENTVINATKLSGFLSSDFAKVSDLSSYAPVSHSHSKSQITDFYDYQIYASAYNVNIDGSVNITVKVTNRATGNPVVGVTVPVLKNNSSWKSGTTGVNGTFSLSYTADTWGITTFSAKTQNCQINVTGWKKVQTALNSNNNHVDIYSDGKLVTFTINTNNLTVIKGQATQITTFNTAYAPIYVTAIPTIQNALNIIAIIEGGGIIKIKNETDTNGNMWGTITVPLKAPLY